LIEILSHELDKRRRSMKTRLYGLIGALIVFSLTLAACGSSSAADPTATPVVTEEPPAPEPETTMEPTMEEPAEVEPTEEPMPVAEDETIMLADTAFGSVLVDAAGLTLYLFTNDEPGVSNCYGGCASNWPPLLVDMDPHAGEGIQTDFLGTTTRTDGSVQVTYGGWPLYYFITDSSPGDTNGQGVGGVWYVISAGGEAVLEEVGAGDETVMLADTTFGSILVDAAGLTLYLFTNDEPDVSNCYGGCATNWPPLLVDMDPHAGDGVQTDFLGTTTRTDGSVQVTYGGWPLYYFINDSSPGETNGQGVGGVWYVISAGGEAVLEEVAAEDLPDY
jgi:predicted lipoprotein with Yx(FWY)xxD motif